MLSILSIVEQFLKHFFYFTFKFRKLPEQWQYLILFKKQSNVEDNPLFIYWTLSHFDQLILPLAIENNYLIATVLYFVSLFWKLNSYNKLEELEKNGVIYKKSDLKIYIQEYIYYIYNLYYNII